MDDDDLHSSDTVQEKLSLVYRFGVRIYYGAPSKKEFQTIVKALAEKRNIMPEDELLLEANSGKAFHGGLTEELHSSLSTICWVWRRNKANR